MPPTAPERAPPGTPGADAPAPAAPAADPAAPGAAPEGTYGQILRSSALVGGASAFNVVVGIVRSKALALLLGPAGFGLMGVYVSIANLAHAVAGMGVNASGVRQIAAAAGSGDASRVARTAGVLRRTSVALGALAVLALVALAGPVSQVTFGDDRRALALAALSAAVAFRIVSDGQGALLQGLRRIRDLAWVSVLGGLAGAVAAVLLVWRLGERGVVPALVAMSAATLAASWWFSRRAGVRTPRLSLGEARRDARELLSLGFAFMASGVFSMGAAYLVRLLLVRGPGFEAAGLFQSAWTVGGLYVGFVLQAMGADFYPRLTAAIRDRAAANRIVNEQAQVSLLLAGPGVLATLTFSPLVLSLLYSPAFLGAVDVLRWITLGAALQVITWPLGFVIVAEGRRALFLAAEVSYTAIYLGLAVLLVRTMGLAGAGVAFFLSYVAHGAIVYPLARRITGFRWSRANARLGLAFLAAAGAVVAAFQLLPYGAALAFGAAAVVASTATSARALSRLVPPERWPGPLRRLLALRRGPGAGPPGGGA